jgi:hypothetical protein
MSHCHDEQSHSHGSSDGHDHSAHDHSDDITPALQNILYAQLDFPRLVTLNEDESNSGRSICQKVHTNPHHP